MKAAILLMLAAPIAASAVETGDFGERFAAAAEKGDDAQVETLLAAWKNAEPASAEPYIAAASYYGDQAQSKASAALEAAVEKFPDRLDLRFGLAYFHQNFGNFDRQVATLEEILAYAAKHPAGLLWGEETLSDPVETIASAAQGQMTFYFGRHEPGDTERALKLAQLVHATYPQHPYALHVIGYYYADREEWNRATPYYEKALALAPDNLLVLLNLGIADAELGNKEKARRSFEKILALGGDPEVLDLAKQKLADLR